MANQEHLDILKQGVEVWNGWREQHPDIEPDFTGAHLGGFDFSGFISGAMLSKSNFKDATLGHADFSYATLVKANFRWAHLDHANFDEANLSEANFNHASLNETSFRHANLSSATFYKADLHGAYLSWATLCMADFREANLYGAYLRSADLRDANLEGADLSRANFSWADYRSKKRSKGPDPYGHRGANLNRAKLADADLIAADLSTTDLSWANLSGADLSWANLSNANLSNADLTDCRIYAVSAWNVQLQNTQQTNMIITVDDESRVTVDNLEVAQFIYLLLNNQKIREVIDTVARKAVLILGRFTLERKAVLDALREALRTHGYAPILFDFSPSSRRNFTETVRTLAHLSRFIIADLTDPSSIPQELYAIVPTLAVPVRPVLLEGEKEYAMFSDLFTRYHWVLPIHFYKDQADLLATLKEQIIEPAEQKAEELEKR
jgi:uncharacterized protein YjbI with pentapeptide repeats